MSFTFFLDYQCSLCSSQKIREENTSLLSTTSRGTHLLVNSFIYIVTSSFFLCFFNVVEIKLYVYKISLFSFNSIWMHLLKSLLFFLDGPFFFRFLASLGLCCFLCCGEQGLLFVVSRLVCVCVCVCDVKTLYGIAAMENSRRFPQKTKNRITIWSSNYTSGYRPKWIESRVMKRYL